MKAVLVVGNLNDKLRNALNRCVSDKLISHFVNYEMYNEVHKKVNEEMHLTNAALSNEEFCEMFISTTKFDQEEWIIMKGDIHTKEFLKILIKFEKSFDPLDNGDLFLSHIVELVNKDKKGSPKSFYLTDAALNTKQIEERSVLDKVISNAQYYVFSKKKGVAQIDTEINTAIILAANNKNIPGYDTVDKVINFISDIPFKKDVKIKQFDECFSSEAYYIKNNKATDPAYTCPDLLVTPDITTGNVIWKSLTILNNWYAKGYVIGGKLTTVLLSRSDSEESYYESIKGVK